VLEKRHFLMVQTFFSKYKSLFYYSAVTSSFGKVVEAEQSEELSIKVFFDHFF